MSAKRQRAGAGWKPYVSPEWSRSHRPRPRVKAPTSNGAGNGNGGNGHSNGHQEDHSNGHPVSAVDVPDEYSAQAEFYKGLLLGIVATIGFLVTLIFLFAGILARSGSRH